MKTYLISTAGTLILAISLSSAARQAGDARSEIRTLEPGAAVQREIRGGEKHLYQVAALPDQFLKVSLHQRDANLILSVYAPGSQQADEIDQAGTGQLERALLIAPMAGVCRFEVRAENASGQGSYEIKLEEARAATEKDRLIIEGLRRFAEAEQSQSRGNAEGLRAAVEKFQQSVDLFRSGGDREGEGTSLVRLGLAHRLLGDNQKALDRFAQALPLLVETRSQQRESAVYNNIAGIYHSRGLVEKAEGYYRQSLSILRQLGDTNAQAIVLNNISVVCLSLGDYQQALDYLRQALPLRRANKDRRGEARTLNNFAQVYASLGDGRTALGYLAEALTAARDGRDRATEALTLNNFGGAYRALGDHQKAKSYFEESLPILREAGDKSGQAVALNNLGSAFLKLGETQKAIEHFEKALHLARAVEERHREATVLSNLGQAHFDARRYDKSLGYFSESLQLRRQIGDRAGQADTLYGIAALERERGNLDEARARSEESLLLVESVRSKVGNLDLRTSYLATRRDYYDLRIDTLMRLHKERPSEGFDALALETSERARARNLIDTLMESSANIREGVDAALLERETALQKLINSREAYRMQFASSRATLKQAQELEEELKKLLAESAEVRERMRASNPRYAALIQPATLRLEEIQKLIDSDTILLEYSLGRNSSCLWAVTASSMESYALPPRQEIETLARRVYDLLTTRNRRVEGESLQSRRARIAQADAEFEIASSSLSRMIVGPASALLNRKRILVVAEGALQYIPFAALPAPSGSLESGVASRESGGRKKDSRPSLIASHEIINLPSASSLAALRREAEGRRPSPRPIAVFADPVFAGDDPRIKSASRKESISTAESPASEVDRSARESGVDLFRRLRFSRLEAEAISSLAPQGGLKAVDFDASRARATGDELSRYRILHFATHGLLNNETPELSGLVLSLVDEDGKPVDGFLRMHEIYNLRLNADLVVLSACQTALGKEIRGEGLVGLTRGFMYAGTSRVVASLWSVEDRATSELMKRFYQNMLAGGKKPAAALRAAQAEMSKHAQWASPYFWAAFVMQGEWK